jgi:hypothetical protein
VDGNDGGGVRRAGGGGGVNIQQQSVRIHVHRNDAGTTLRHRQPGGDEGVGGHDHLVARADPAGPQRDGQRVQSVAHPDGVVGSAEGGKVPLEGLDLLTEYVLSRRHDPLEGGPDLVLQLDLSGVDVEVGNVHPAGTPGAMVRNSS